MRDLLLNTFPTSVSTEVLVALTLISSLVLFEYTRQSNSKSSETMRKGMGVFVLLCGLLWSFLIVRRVLIYVT